MLNVILLYVTMPSHYARRLHAEYCYAECRRNCILYFLCCNKLTRLSLTGKMCNDF
jgi:hypothetical protein